MLLDLCLISCGIGIGIGIGSLSNFNDGKLFEVRSDLGNFGSLRDLGSFSSNFAGFLNFAGPSWVFVQLFFFDRVQFWGSILELVVVFGLGPFCCSFWRRELAAPMEKRACMHSRIRMRWWICLCCKSGEASLDGLPTSRQPSLQLSELDLFGHISEFSSSYTSNMQWHVPIIFFQVISRVGDGDHFVA
jgi:hypothetical protein